MELTEKEFCKAYTAFYGEEITSIVQIQLNRSTGKEMFEFAEGLVKNLTIPVVSNNEVAICEYAKNTQGDKVAKSCNECTLCND